MGVKILLLNHLMLGDTVLMTAGIRDLKLQYPEYDIKVETNFAPIWENNPHLSQFDTPDETYNVGPKIVTQTAQTNGLHISNAVRVCLEDRLKKPIPQGPFRGEMFFSPAEKSQRPIEGAYWVINIDCGPYDSKRWSSERWQQVVDALPEITFVQVGLQQDNSYQLQGRNVLNYLGKTQGNEGLRRLFTLVHHAEGSLGLISSLMHIAGALEKPAVIVAGAREPVSFEMYPWHRYLHNQGSLKCAKVKSCFRCRLSACEKSSGGLVNGLPRCMDMIQVEDVVKAVRSYYIGGALQGSSSVEVRAKKLLKIVAYASCLGGAEQSVIDIANMALDKEWLVDIVPRKMNISEGFRQQLPRARFTNELTARCDSLLLYASDMVYDFHKPDFDCLRRSQARKKYMALTYKIGKSVTIPWAKGWDRYIFLSSSMEQQFLRRLPGEKTCVLTPPVELELYLPLSPDYNAPLHILRHSSQGDAKFHKDTEDLIRRCVCHFSFMPAPTFLPPSEQITIYQSDGTKLKKFLATGNCFWYLLPDGYTDQGPRVIIEAMAAGLPVIAENRDGARDRVTPETGWLVDSHEEAIEIINSLTPELLETKGRAAKQRAQTQFVKTKWLDVILEE